MQNKKVSYVCMLENRKLWKVAMFITVGYSLESFVWKL